MALSSEQLTKIGEGFLASLNARDFDAAASLYADEATYESAALVNEDRPDGRITGRDQIIGFFTAALESDEEFKLSLTDIFTGLNVAIVLSSLEGRTFIDVLRSGEDGLITEHFEVQPKAPGRGLS